MSNKQPLGKGLAALIRPIEEKKINEVEIKEIIKEVVKEITPQIEISKIKPNPLQPRKNFDSTSLEELKLSIKENGIIQPITIRKIDAENYEIISGERRFRASVELGMQTIPSHIIEVESNEKMLELALIENIQRENLNPIEIAFSYQRLIEECNLTHEKVAEKVGKNRTTITNFLRLLKLPQVIQEALKYNELTEGHARNIVSIADEKTQIKIFEKIRNENLSVRQVENLVKNLSLAISPKLESNKISFEHPIVVKLREEFSTKISITQKRGGRGEIVFEYYSLDDFDRLIELLLKK